MNLLISSSTDPYHNLATEEFLLKNSGEDFICLYVNRPCVVVGKHQNAQKEIDSKFAFNNNILVARRLSGGGAVYHDEGNLNFSFIRSVSFGENISYQSITQFLFAFLKQLVPSIYLSERNDFLLDGNKISGSAMHVYKNRVMAHCTLLIDCNLSNLSASLKGDRNRFRDKSIESVRSKVANLSPALDKITVKNVITNFTDYIKSEDMNVKLISLQATAGIPINKLVTEKYSTPEWIFGYSPKYTYTNSFTFNNNLIRYSMEVEKGIIERFLFESTDELTDSMILLSKSLEGKLHHIDFLHARLKNPDPTSFESHLLHSLF